MNSNLIPFVMRQFTKSDRTMLADYVDTLREYLSLPFRLEYAFSDEGDEYCCVLGHDDHVKAHVAKTRTGYIMDCSKYGVTEGRRLESVLFHPDVPVAIQSLFQTKRKAIV